MRVLHSMPVCTLAELEEEIVDVRRALERARDRVPVSEQARVRRLESVQGLREWLADLTAQRESMDTETRP